MPDGQASIGSLKINLLDDASLAILATLEGCEIVKLLKLHRDRTEKLKDTLKEEKNRFRMGQTTHTLLL